MARYYRTQLVNPISQFVAEPLNLYQNKLEGMQAKQDAGVKGIEVLGKELTPLDIDRQRAFEKKQEIDAKLESGRNINYNDPQGKKQAFELTKSLRDEFGDFGEASAINKRKEEYVNTLKDITSDKELEPWMAESLVKELNTQIDPNNPNANTLNYDPKTGKYNQIKPPVKFNKVDPQAKIDNMLEKVVTDSYEQGFSPYRSVAEYQNAWRQGTVTERTAEKINEALIQRSLGDKDLTTYLSKREQYEGINPKGENFFVQTKDGKVVGNPNTLLGNMIAGATRGWTKRDVDAKYSVVDEELNLARAKRKEEEEAQAEAYETTFSQMGQQGVNNLSEVAKAEPTNSLLSKVFNFVNPNNQAKGLLNIAKLIVPGLTTLPQIQNIEKQLTEDANLSEDQLNKKVEAISYEIKQQIGRDDKAFREKFGFSNPVLAQTFDLVNMFGKGKDTESNADYERAKEVVASQDPTFNTLTKQQQFSKVKEEMDKFVESSKTNVVLVPMDQKELNFKNAQLANVTGTPTEKTQQLMNLGLTANGKFVDFYTGKETTLEDIAGEGNELKYMGELENDNQFGPGMNYFQSADGKFYVSPGSLNNQKDNYINWNLKQVNNKFSKDYEFPLLFEDRRQIKEDGTIPKGVPKASVTKDLKTGKLKAKLQLTDNEEINVDANSEDEIKIGIAKTLFDKGYTIEQIKQLGL